MNEEFGKGDVRPQVSFDIKSHIEAVEHNIKALDSIDICLIFLHLNPIEFATKFREWVKQYQREIGKDPEFDLVFVIDDMGENDEIKRGKLRQLKAMVDNSFTRKYVKKITVKGANRDAVVGLEQNVFSSGVGFEELK